MPPRKRDPERVWTDGHQGGRYDADTAHRLKMLKKNASLTEVFGVTEAKGLPKIDGYGKSGRECKTYFDLRSWKRKEHDIVEINTSKWVRGTSRRNTVDLEWTFLDQIIAQWTLMRLIGHFPAHLFLAYQKRANTQALRKLGDEIKKLQDEYQPDEFDLSLDLNRDLRLEKNRDLVEQSLKGTGLHIILPPHGTYKKREIDLLASTAKHRGPVHMFPDYNQFDHTGYYSHLAA